MGMAAKRGKGEPAWPADRVERRSIVTSRIILAAKLAAGADATSILLKELSLGGVQRPVAVAELGPGAVEWFRFGDFAGWLIEASP